MLNIYCVCTGDKYSNDYVYKLKSMVERNLTAPHDFYCVTDKDIPGLNCIMLDESFPYSGWWQKLRLFGLGKGPFIFFDLDVVIVGSLDFLVNYTAYDIAMPKVFTPGGKGFQSSIFCSNGKWNAPFAEFEPNEFSEIVSKKAPYGIYSSRKIRGDQEYLSFFYSDKIVPIDSGIFSYKIHCKDGLRSLST